MKLSLRSLVLFAPAFALLAPACSANNNNGSGFGASTSGGNGTKTAGSDGGPGDQLGDDGGKGLNTTGDSGGGNNFLDAGCATASATASREPVYMLFILDGSGSMKQQNKWAAAVPALDSIFDDMLTQKDTGFGAGLIVFSDSKDGSCSSGGFGSQCAGPYPSSSDISIGFVDQTQHDKLRGRIDASTPSSTTPTQAALTGGYGELEQFTPSGQLLTGGKKVLVLMTDGVPTDTCGSGSNYTSNPCVTQAAAELAKAGPQGPVTTFVIGVGNFPSSSTASYDPSFLGYLAQSGGTAPTGCNPAEASNAANLCYFEIDPAAATTPAQLQQQFTTAIDKIRGQVASCTFKLDGTDGGKIDPTKVNVTINGQTVLQDPQNGWTYDDPNNPTEVILHGTACDEMKNGGSATASAISIVLGCETQVAK